MKVCFKCKIELPVSDFQLGKRSTDGLQAACKTCTSAYNKAWYAANKARKNAATAAWHAANREHHAELGRAWRTPERQTVYNNRRRACRLAADTDGHTPEQLTAHLATYGGKCWICLRQITGKTHVDHVWPLSKGGSNRLFNLRPACAPCNISKHDIWPFDPTPYRR